MTGNDADFARWLGVNKSTISRARRAGRLVLTVDGHVDFEASAARWHETAGGRTDVAARHAEQRGAAIPTAHRSEKNATARDSARDAGLDDDTASADSRRGAKVALLRYEIRAIKHEMALRRGLRVERAAMKREGQGLGALLRAGAERVTDQTAPRLAASGDANERLRLIEKEIRRLAWIVKREMPRALRRMKDAGRTKGGEA